MKKVARSITEQVYNEVRADLIRCTLKPGERLATNLLSQRFGVSLSAVREALSRLVSEGLVLADPQRGFRAAPISSEDLLNLMEAAAGIEAMCIRSALAAGDKAWEERLVAARDAALAAPLTSPAAGNRISDAFSKAHQDFHQTLMSACSNARISDLRRQLHDQSERYRELCIPMTHDIDALKQGYEEITTAALARDVDRTTMLVTKQLQRNVDRFVQALDSEDAVRFWVDELGAPKRKATRRRKPKPAAA